MSENFEQQYLIKTAADLPNMLDLGDEITMLSWAEFMLHDAISNNFWNRLYDDFPEFQFCLIERETDEIIAKGNCIPLRYDGQMSDLPDDGWDWALQKGFDDLKAGIKPNLVSALNISIHPVGRDKRLSIRMLQAMKAIVKANDLHDLIAPVRPNLKTRYPLTPIENYMKWRDDDGHPFDPWLRVHERDGGKIIKPCEQSMIITGTIAEWEEWTTYKFPESGSYVIPGGIAPVEIDLESNRGIYIEPNIWVHHLIE